MLEKKIRIFKNIFDNKLKKMNKNTNKWIFLILIGFIYQLIDLTIDYLSYNYVIETNIYQIRDSHGGGYSQNTPPLSFENRKIPPL